MLIEHITELTDCGFVIRKSNDSYPLIVTYTLTPLGKELIKGLEIFQQVGLQLLEEKTYLINRKINL